METLVFYGRGEKAIQLRVLKDKKRSQRSYTYPHLQNWISVGRCQTSQIKVRRSYRKAEESIGPSNLKANG